MSHNFFGKISNLKKKDKAEFAFEKQNGIWG